MGYANKVKKNCIHCQQCTKHCSFLRKYSMDLSSFAERKELAYHCFLCGACHRACPKHLDGSRLSQEMREENPQGFRVMKWKKVPYKFANNSNKISKELLFLGCNFPGYYPETSRMLIDTFEKYQIDFSIDCCGKPVYETGDSWMTQKSIQHIKNLIDRKNIERLICVCPNCYYYLKDRLETEVISIYEKLQELGIGEKIEGQAYIFQPCPDKEHKEILRSMQPFLNGYILSNSDINCCGLGGLARKQEPELADGFLKLLEQKETKDVYTYCATCSGSLSKGANNNIKHLLSEILGVREETNQRFAQNVASIMQYKKRR